MEPTSSAQKISPARTLGALLLAPGPAIVAEFVWLFSGLGAEPEAIRSEAFEKASGTFGTVALFTYAAMFLAVGLAIVTLRALRRFDRKHVVLFLASEAILGFVALAATSGGLPSTTEEIIGAAQSSVMIVTIALLIAVCTALFFGAVAGLPWSVARSRTSAEPSMRSVSNQ